MNHKNTNDKRTKEAKTGRRKSVAFKIHSGKFCSLPVIQVFLILMTANH